MNDKFTGMLVSQMDQQWRSGWQCCYKYYIGPNPPKIPPHIQSGSSTPTTPQTSTNAPTSITNTPTSTTNVSMPPVIVSTPITNGHVSNDQCSLLLNTAGQLPSKLFTSLRKPIPTIPPLPQFPPMQTTTTTPITIPINYKIFKNVGLNKDEATNTLFAALSYPGGATASRTKLKKVVNGKIYNKLISLWKCFGKNGIISVGAGGTYFTIKKRIWIDEKEKKYIKTYEDLHLMYDMDTDVKDIYVAVQTRLIERYGNNNENECKDVNVNVNDKKRKRGNDNDDDEENKTENKNENVNVNVNVNENVKDDNVEMGKEYENVNVGVVKMGKENENEPPKKKRKIGNGAAQDSTNTM
eukprot:442847_1